MSHTLRKKWEKRLESEQIVQHHGTTSLFETLLCMHHLGCNVMHWEHHVHNNGSTICLCQTSNKSLSFYTGLAEQRVACQIAKLAFGGNVFPDAQIADMKALKRQRFPASAERSGATSTAQSPPSTEVLPKCPKQAACRSPTTVCHWAWWWEPPHAEEAHNPICKTPSDQFSNAKKIECRPNLRFLGTCDCSWIRLRNVHKIDLALSFPPAVPQLDKAQNLKAVTLSNQQLHLPLQTTVRYSIQSSSITLVPYMICMYVCNMYIIIYRRLYRTTCYVKILILILVLFYSNSDSLMFLLHLFYKFYKSTVPCSSTIKTSPRPYGVSTSTSNSDAQNIFSTSHISF